MSSRIRRFAVVPRYGTNGVQYAYFPEIPVAYGQIMRWSRVKGQEIVRMSVFEDGKRFTDMADVLRFLEIVEGALYLEPVIIRSQDSARMQRARWGKDSRPWGAPVADREFGVLLED